MLYRPDIQAAAKAGTLKPNDYTSQNLSYASAAGGVISTANDLVAWMQALVGGKVLNAEYQCPVDRKENDLAARLKLFPGQLTHYLRNRGR